jgi:hypothetical protein
MGRAAGRGGQAGARRHFSTSSSTPASLQDPQIQRGTLTKVAYRPLPLFMPSIKDLVLVADQRFVFIATYDQFVMHVR